MMTADISTKAAEYLKKPYSRVLIPEEGGGYSAEILEFPGCYSQGDTAAEAIQNIEEAARNWIEATLEADRPIPTPATDNEFGGKVALRVPRSIHRQAVRMAERDGVSLNQWLVTAIAARVGAEELYNRLVDRAEHSWINRALAADNRFSKVLALMRGWLRTYSDTTPIETGMQDATTQDVTTLLPRSTSETIETRG